MRSLTTILIFATLAAVAGCATNDRGSATSGVTAMDAGCTGDDDDDDSCTDPEQEAGSYVSIGVMPAPYPISWASPYDLFVTVLGTSAAGAGLDRSHSIGHVLLKVRCGTNEPYYISQTGANGSEKRQFWDIYHKGPNYLFVTQTDGKLYTDAEAKDDWDTAIKKQEALANDTYSVDPNPDDIKETWEKRRIWDLPGMDTIQQSVRDLPPKDRHRFVRATIRISDAQCKAITDWKNDYVAKKGPSRYGVHRAPWVIDANGEYDGGGCGSVSFAGAFYAAGLDYKRVAPRVIERLAIGTSRITANLVRDPRGHDGWFNTQNSVRYAPGNIPFARAAQEFHTNWKSDHWKRWNGGLTGPPWDRVPKDTASAFSNNWSDRKPVTSGIIPFLLFEPEKFYSEILGRWKNDSYDAFAYSGWCKLKNSKVPVIVLDARTLTGTGEAAGGRPVGLKDGFANAEVRLP